LVIERTLFSFIWKYSKREQFVLLVVTTALFPLLYLTLELPKRIINDAIDAKEVPVQFWGMELEQTTFLGVLCAAFLVAVLCHGLLKMRINTMKGVLAERMLRRLRYTLIARILRFPSSYFERTSQGELVSMVTAEAEPMGGLMGDALAQPVLQAGQMLTILSFLFLQSFWFGVAACAMIPLQAWLIPKLQKQINLLNKKRVVQVRALAAEIGENAAGASTLRLNGGWRYRKAMISDRLGRLFAIRFEIYQKKFFMKFLNNFITQLTPFFFFSVGGFLVIQGSVTLGALVAALAAYKDLSSPWKELLAYYNQSQDMSLRWEVIVERFAPDNMIDESLFDTVPDEIPALKGDIVLERVGVIDEDGNSVLEDINTTLPAGATVSIVAPSEEDRRAFAALLSRELLPNMGSIQIGGQGMNALHQAAISQRIGVANSRPVLFQGTFGDNMLMPVRFAPVGKAADPESLADAIRAGNSDDPLNADWTDPGLSGNTDAESLRHWWVQVLEGVGSGSALFRRGLEQTCNPDVHTDLADRIVELRARVAEMLSKESLDKHIYFFEPDSYNAAMPVADNLMFAVPEVPVTRETLREQTEFLATLRSLGLDESLRDLSQDVIEMLRQIFGTDGTDHPLFRKLGLSADVYETAVSLIANARNQGWGELDDDSLAVLLTVPFSISAEKIGPAFPERMKDQVLALRKAHAETIQKSLGGVYTPLDRNAYAPGLTVLENAIFGKITDSAGPRAEDIRARVSDVLAEAGVKSLVMRLMYDLPIALGGANLPAMFAEPLAFARAVIKRPDILVLDNALASFDAETRRDVFVELRNLLPEVTIIHLADRLPDGMDFDLALEIRQGRLTTGESRDESEEDSAARADLNRKLRALEQSDLFAGLDRKQLRLLAFGARWYRADAGEYVFHKGDEPNDGAYMIIEGDAGLYLPIEGQEPKHIATVGSGKLVGELGLIRRVPRALSMRADTDLVCLRIGEEEFLAVVENDAATAFKLLQVVAGYVSS
jgi:ABC-type multidrug transport system fused ATPase/permease subunit